MNNVDQEQLQTTGLDVLIRQATQYLNTPDPDTGSPHPTWMAVFEMRRRGTRTVFDAMTQLCRSGDPRSRQVGALVLGQLGISASQTVPPFWQEQVLELMTLLNRETVGQNDPEVLKDACVSLGHLNDVRAVPPILKLKRHRDARVRYGVAFGLTGHDDPRAVEGLIELAGDFDDRVREWATFGLARVIHTNTPELRTALFANLKDASEQIRSEAIFGLAQRRDGRVLPPLTVALESSSPHELALQAAAILGDHNLCELLLRAAQNADNWTSPQQEALVEALRACQC